MPDKDVKDAIDAYIQNDAFARLLGAEVTIMAPGHSRVSLTVTEEMTNFHGMTHGGVIFALGDMAFAAAGKRFELHGQLWSCYPPSVAERLFKIIFEQKEY